MSNKTKPYVLLHGKHFITNEAGEQVVLTPGDVAHLTDEQFQSFRDRFRDAHQVKMDQEALAAKVKQKAEDAQKAESQKAKADAQASATQAKTSQADK